ncbi:hypothetical protein [Seonamhaeicola maritimus]|uniref:Uncharacterized protein n=1 Tax=Seonamhaeicola maritimus TaxID=2591822 RepID=A0A5C7GLL8_9FLAO|nr:hypothetical protein [Seonamhaeicola maritimus]TXG39228.1 hypothetical protein FUA22_04955 [Seonamhaeicola maritimus]
MSPLKSILALSLILVTINGFSQQKTQEQKEREKNKVELYTPEEKDNLQNFYAEEVNKMKLSEEIKSEYYNILLFYTHSMSRLDDKDKDYTQEEISGKFNILHFKMNEKMKALLTPEQYVIHLETFNKILYSVSRKTSLFNQKK